MRLLFVSNGHGEDTIGAVLAQALRPLGYDPVAVPLVGRGEAYEQAGFPVLGPQKEMPSGGFAARNPAHLWADLRAGWLSMSLKHYQAVRQVAKEAVATVVVGDVYALGVGVVFAGEPLFLVQCQSSVRALSGPERPYSVTERLLMRQAVQVYPREAEAADWLWRAGLANVRYLGNPMLDAPAEGPVGVKPPYLLLLPGSRADFYHSLPRMLEAVRRLGESGLTPVVAWAGLPLAPLQVEGWTLEPGQEPPSLRHREGHRVYLVQGAFKTLLQGAKAALSTSGTAAEQAAGYGVPLVGFPTPGPQYTLAFAQKQKRLLGEALRLVAPEPEAIAAALRAVLNEEARQQAQAAGRAAMGEPGAAWRIAQDIHHRLVSLGPSR